MARMHCGGVQVVGTRGDVQPFLAVARALRRHGHRVRLATHAVYRDFVEQHGVEFFPLAGGPSQLADFITRKGAPAPQAAGGADVALDGAAANQARDFVVCVILLVLGLADVAR